MKLEVNVADGKEIEKWDNFVSMSPYGTIFHTLEWLKIVEKCSSAKLYPLIGLRGDEVIGLCPIFYLKRGFLRMVFSPPPRTLIPNLGPLVLGVSSRGRKIESTNMEFQEGIDLYVSGELRPDYLSIRFPLDWHDVRVFKWRGYDVEPLYTYFVDTSRGEEKLWNDFSSGLRREIGKIPANVTVRLGNEDDMHIVYDMMSQRYAEQNMAPSISKDYFDSLSKQFYNKNMKVFLALADNRVVSGLVLVFYGHTALFWFGLPKRTHNGHPINELIQWEAIKWCCRNGIREYDLVGANTPRLVKFKMKYSPSLALYFNVKRANPIGKLGEKAFLSLWKGRTSI
jgi:hypothetical protein